MKPTRPLLDPDEPASLLILADWIEEYSPYELSLAATLRWCYQHDRLPVRYTTTSTPVEVHQNQNAWTRELIPTSILELLPEFSDWQGVACYRSDAVGYELAFMALDRQFVLLHYMVRHVIYEPAAVQSNEGRFRWRRQSSERPGTGREDKACLPGPLFDRLSDSWPISGEDPGIWERDYASYGLALGALERARRSLLAWLPCWE